MIKKLIVMWLFCCSLATAQGGSGGGGGKAGGGGGAVAPIYNACLIHAWPMNEGSGSTFHDLIGSDPMTIGGTVVWQENAGLPGTTPFFNGAGFATGVTASDLNFDGSNPFTIVLWTTGSSVRGYALQSWLVGNLAGFDQTEDFKGWLVFQNANNPDGGAAPQDANAGIFNLFQTNGTGFMGGAIQVNPATTSIVAPTPAPHFYAVSYTGNRSSTGVTIVFDGTTYSVANSNLTIIFDNLTATTATTTPIQVGEAPAGSGPTTSIPYTGAMGYLAIYNCAVSSSTLLTWEAQSPRIN